VLIGYNTNVTYRGQTYHVQTEDSGSHNPFIVTLLYLKGAILRSKKTSYTHLLGVSDFEEQLRTIMKEQHKEMIKDLFAGRTVAAAEEVRPSESQEERPAGDAQGGEGSKSGVEKEISNSELREEYSNDYSATTDKRKTGNAKSIPDRSKSLDEILLDHLSRRRQG
jgi:hypothetical protein